LTTAGFFLKHLVLMAPIMMPSGNQEKPKMKVQPSRATTHWRLC
jgi:hypothetical protein